MVDVLQPPPKFGAVPVQARVKVVQVMRHYVEAVAETPADMVGRIFIKVPAGNQVPKVGDTLNITISVALD